MWPTPPAPIVHPPRQCAGCKKDTGEMFWVPRKRRGFIELRRLCETCTPQRLIRAL